MCRKLLRLFHLKRIILYGVMKSRKIITFEMIDIYHYITYLLLSLLSFLLGNKLNNKPDVRVIKGGKTEEDH